MIAALATALALAAPAAPGRPALRLVPVASGLDSPTYVAAPPSEPGRLYVVEKPGRIRLLVGGRLLPQPFLDIRRLVKSDGYEQGLFSVAFHPGYPHDPRLYVDYTDRNGDIRVVEYRSNGSRALLRTARQILFLEHPFANHNGGQLQFGPDGLLYAGMGDGGSEGDPQNRAQNLSTLLGKLLRIDVDAPRPSARIVAYGLRNPWRFSFDRGSGDLYLADVGQDRFEEIDYVPRGSAGLLNFGWSVYEGRARFKDEALNPAGRLVWPITVYGHEEGNCSVTGGYVYRGDALPAERGRYVYGDFCSGAIWSLQVAGGRAASLRREQLRVRQLSSFGEDARGELYAVSLAGTVYRLAP